VTNVKERRKHDELIIGNRKGIRKDEESSKINKNSQNSCYFSGCRRVFCSSQGTANKINIFYRVKGMKKCHVNKTDATGYPIYSWVLGSPDKLLS
jgi:hypothetical protein